MTYSTIATASSVGFLVVLALVSLRAVLASWAREKALYKSFDPATVPFDSAAFCASARVNGSAHFFSLSARWHRRRELWVLRNHDSFLWCQDRDLEFTASMLWTIQTTTAPPAVARERA